jgi:CubicO group peptidase (beta-lactamase class C family)
VSVRGLRLRRLSARAARAALAALGLAAGVAAAAPDELRLGRAAGYPVGTARTWFADESVRVGSFSAQGEIPGILGGAANVLAPATEVMPLPRAAVEPDYRWRIDGASDLTVDDYLARQRIMGLLIVKDGVVQVERYQYDRSPAHRFVSHSMAKSILSIGVGIALAEGRIRSLDDRADAYAPGLGGSLLGATSVRDLLRMASGARCTEVYDGRDDAARFSAAIVRAGIEQAAQVLVERAAPAGERFSYCSAHSHVLAAVMRGATGQTLSDYLAPRLWQAIGAETSALWRADRTGLEAAGGNFNATLRDWGRLGIVLANDGVRPDRPHAGPVLPRDWLLEATDWRRHPAAFHPGRATPNLGYGYHVWTYPGEARRFALLGVYGQRIFVDPALKLVIVQLTANATAQAGGTSLARESGAFVRGVVGRYGAW